MVSIYISDTYWFINSYCSKKYCGKMWQKYYYNVIPLYDNLHFQCPKFCFSSKIVNKNYFCNIMDFLHLIMGYSHLCIYNSFLWKESNSLIKLNPNLIHDKHLNVNYQLLFSIWIPVIKKPACWLYFFNMYLIQLLRFYSFLIHNFFSLHYERLNILSLIWNFPS